MKNWFHQFWNPHCPECREERESARVCNSCEIYRSELDRLIRSNERLLAQILEPAKRNEMVEVSRQDFQPITRSVPWRVRQQMLEEEDRNKARVLAAQKLAEMKPGEVTADSLDDELESFKRDSNG